MANSEKWLTEDTMLERCADFVTIQTSLEAMKRTDFESKEEYESAIDFIKKEHKETEARGLDQLMDNYHRGELKGIIKGGVAALTGMVIGDLIGAGLVKLLDKKK